MEDRKLERGSNPFVDARIFSPVRIFCPGIEMEGADTKGRRRIAFPDKHRPEVSCPSPVGGEMKELHARGICADAMKNPASGPFMVAKGNDADVLVDGDRTDDLAIDPGDRSEFPRPIAPVMRPPDPRCFVGFPFSREAIAERGWCAAFGSYGSDLRDSSSRNRRVIPP